MSPILWSWILSLTGAALFFAAGAALTARRRSTAPLTLTAQRGLSGDLLDLRSGLDPARSGPPVGLPIPTPAITVPPRDAPSELPRATDAKFDRSPASMPPVPGSSRKPTSIGLGSPAAGAPPIGVPVKPAPSGPDPSLEAARAALSECKSRVTGLERDLERSTRERGQLANELDAERKRAEQERETHGGELKGLQTRIHELTARGGADARTAALQHELAMSQETLRTRDTQLEQLREESARLHQVEEELARTRRELDAQTEETRAARSQAFAGKPQPRPRPSAPPKPDLPISAHVRELQTIVDAETKQGRCRSAVIADELGLLVASSGTDHEYIDALAAMGAYLADLGTKTRDVLPLHKVRQVVVRDDHDVTLTVRPLTADDPGLALVTLAVEPNGARTETRKN